MKLTMDTMNQLIAEALRRKDGIAVKLPTKAMAERLRFRLYKRRAQMVRGTGDQTEQADLYSLQFAVKEVGDSWHLTVKRDEPISIEILDGAGTEVISEVSSELLESDEVMTFDEDEMKEDAEHEIHHS